MNPVVAEDPGEAHGRLVRTDAERPSDGDTGHVGIARDRTRIKFDMELPLGGQHSAELGEDRVSRVEGARGVSELECHALEV